MRAFFITFLIVILLAAAVVYWLWQNAGSLPEGTVLEQAGQAVHPDQPPPPARTPDDYHVLQNQGGIPLAEATRAGLAGAGYAFLRSFEPIQISDGVAALEGVAVRAKHYDLGYQFESRPPQEQYLEFNIGGQWSELHFGFGFDDGHPSDPENKWAIDLEIQGDGAILLGPQRFSPTSEPLFTSLDVGNVNRLTFVSRRIGHGNPFAPVLLDPFLKKIAPEASE
jgi:hypothetical protein